MRHSIRWAVTCTSRRTNGEPCHRWARRGGFLCHNHFGSTEAALNLAAYRLPLAPVLDKQHPNWRNNPQLARYWTTPSQSWRGPKPPGTLDD
jgi:hypothetical protein